MFSGIELVITNPTRQFELKGENHKQIAVRSLSLSRSVSVCLCLSIGGVSVFSLLFLSVSVSVCLSICLSVCLSVYLSVCQSLCMYLYCLPLPPSLSLTCALTLSLSPALSLSHSLTFSLSLSLAWCCFVSFFRLGDFALKKSIKILHPDVDLAGVCVLYSEAIVILCAADHLCGFMCDVRVTFIVQYNLFLFFCSTLITIRLFQNFLCFLCLFDLNFHSIS